MGTTETRTATRRDGVVLTVGDKVTTDYHPACAGCVFTIATITPFDACESGHMIMAHLEHDAHRELRGTGLGLDANWFKPHHDNATTPVGP